MATWLILTVALGVICQPLLAAAAHDCCCVDEAPPVVETDVDSCCSQDEPAESPPSDEDCGCPKSCCTTMVKSPMSASPWRASMAWDEPVGAIDPVGATTPGDVGRARLKRPPKASSPV